MAVFGRRLFKISAGLFAVHSDFEHLVPVKFMTRLGHLVVKIARMRHAFCNIGGMSRDTACDNALFYVVRIRQSEMLRRGDIA